MDVSKLDDENREPRSITRELLKLTLLSQIPNQEMSEPNSKKYESSSSASPTGLQLAIAVIVLGSSAGFTLYTRKAGSMLKAMETIKGNQLRNRPPKVGPPTKNEWEKLRPRIDKDEFF